MAKGMYGARVDDDVGGYIESERIKRGQTKSGIINELIREHKDGNKGNEERHTPVPGMGMSEVQNRQIKTLQKYGLNDKADFLINLQEETDRILKEDKDKRDKEELPFDRRPTPEIKKNDKQLQRRTMSGELNEQEIRKLSRDEFRNQREREKFEDDLLSKLDTMYKKQCEGDECLRNLEKSHKELKSEVASIREEEPCVGCNSKVRVGSSFCPTCGLKITGWSQLPDWKPTWRK